MTDAREEDRRALDLFDALAALPATAREALLADVEAPLQQRLRRMLAALDTPTRRPALQASQSRHRAGERIAAWRLAACIGRGGMAEVWRAEPVEGRLQRTVALKLPLHLDGSLAERFARERDVLVALDHPHIARLYDAGADAQGHPFLALELVEGLPITQYAAERELGREARLHLALQVLDALGHAHRRLVVHRDLKPSNVMVSAQGEVKLLDFGIAKLLAQPPGAAALTQDVAQLLTPRYAAPEQVSGGAITTATDLYAFGVLLYELLTGRLPYGEPEATLPQALHAVLYTKVESPRLSPDLDAVLMKCLAKEAEQRYASAEHLLDDLRAVLEQRPVSARRSSWMARARLWLRRNRRTAVAGLGGVLLLGGALGMAAQQSLHARAQSERGDEVRRFISDMYSDAEPAAGRSSVSGAELLAAAARRARDSFPDAPRVRAEVLGELARVQIKLQQWADARATLEEALALYANHAPVADPLHNRARAYLASLLVWGDAAERQRAERLAHQALQACGLPDPECATSHGSARYALWLLSTRHADEREGLLQARAMVEASRQAPPSYIDQRIDALETLAGAALFAGQLEESRQTLREVQNLAPGHARKSATALRLEWLGLLLDGLLDSPHPAADALRTLAARSASEGERHRVLRAAAQLELLAARPDAALAILRELPSGAAGLERALSLSGLAAAQAQQGRWEEASTSQRDAQQHATQAGVSAQSLFSQRLRRQQALLDLQADDAAAALQSLRGLDASDSGMDAARALALRGCIRLRQGDRAAAGADTALALQRLPQPAGHPLHLRLRLLQAWADGSPQAAADAQQALLAALPADSPWQTRAPSDCRVLLA
ncbi:MAG: serine/threonine protein kinase [Burkholderiales bacterium]|nr:serine/threonine protein kinase [Burkholderiales bacterium]